ncbi:MAG TPA: hypothetical protein PLT36_05050 [Erysipelotrichaceae bacterium]|nr:hypothetical protein [Erysipelotrichia bacterium]HPX32853.1 hypothetical protein [Erysipelotrichaceae bacterium]HQA84710.1 hypothetical protein [Erysipelotrichaceae bacterium]
MWLFLGLGAIIFALLNLASKVNDKKTQWYRFISLSLTTLTLYDFYLDGAKRVINEDWSALMDSMPTLSGMLLFCVVASILINSVSLFKKNN